MPKINERLTLFINFSIALIVTFFGGSILRNNYLNAGVCLGLTGGLLILQILLSTFDFTNFKLARKDWFGLGTATVFGLISLWLARLGIIELATNSYPQTTLTYSSAATMGVSIPPGGVDRRVSRSGNILDMLFYHRETAEIEVILIPIV